MSENPWPAQQGIETPSTSPSLVRNCATLETHGPLNRALRREVLPSREHALGFLETHGPLNRALRPSSSYLRSTVGYTQAGNPWPAQQGIETGLQAAHFPPSLHSGNPWPAQQGALRRSRLHVRCRSMAAQQVLTCLWSGPSLSTARTRQRAQPVTSYNPKARWQCSLARPPAKQNRLADAGRAQRVDPHIVVGRIDDADKGLHDLRRGASACEEYAVLRPWPEAQQHLGDSCAPAIVGNVIGGEHCRHVAYDLCSCHTPVITAARGRSTSRCWYSRHQVVSARHVMLCDRQRPGRDHVSSTGTDANRWNQ